MKNMTTGIALQIKQAEHELSELIARGFLEGGMTLEDESRCAELEEEINTLEYQASIEPDNEIEKYI